MSSEWANKRLSELASIKTGKLDSNASTQFGRYPFFTCSPITLAIDDFAFDTEAVLLAGNNANGVFATKYYQGKFNAYQRTYVLEALNSESVSCRFLYYAIANQVSHLQELSIGSATKFLTKTILNELPIHVPPRPEQDRIEEVLFALDDRITLLRETNATLEAIAQALFKSWFVDFDPVHVKAEGRAPEGMDEATAALFPDSFEESELGLVPKGWRVLQFGAFIDRMSVGKKYDQKSADPEGSVPILDQGKSGTIGFHNAEPGVKASVDSPVVVFANHTCYMRLITFNFSAIQNVLPFVGKGVDTVWAFYATKDRVRFSEYKGHWPDFAIEKTVVPDQALTRFFRDSVDPLVRSMKNNALQAQTLSTLRDTLLPRLISGRLRLAERFIEFSEIPHGREN